MSKIKIYALGGLGEIGKNMYVCEVDDRIFILDAGLKYPSIDLLGVDSIYPDISSLEKKSKKIVGVFLSHGHDENIGAVLELLKKFNVGVFGSHFTISILEDQIVDAGLKLEDYRLYRVNDSKILKFGNVNVIFYYVSHSIPESTNIAILTEDGAIVYAPDFTFDVINDKHYKISFDKISEISKNGVIAVLSESLGINNLSRAVNNEYMEYNVTQMAMKNKRIFFAMYSSDLEKIQRVANICTQYGKRIVLIGRKTQRIINTALNNNYLWIPEEKLVNLKFRTEDNQNLDDDLAIIVAGLRHEPYYMLQRMCRDQDRLLKIEKYDEVMLICPPQAGCERIASRTVDELLMTGAHVYQLNKQEVRGSHADPEELKLLYNMLKPKYIIPINGEYRHQYVHKQMAIQSGFNDEQVLLLKNGEVIEFEDGINKGIVESVSSGDVLVDGSVIGDINEIVLKEREMMSEEGVIIVAGTIDLINKKIISNPVCLTKGVALDENDTLVKDIENYSYNFLNNYLRIKSDDIILNDMLREALSNFVSENTKKRPIILPSIIEIKD